MRCGVGSDPMLLCLWCRPAATAPVQPLAWEPPYAMSAALKRPPPQKKGGRGTLLKELCFYYKHCNEFSLQVLSI